MVNHARMNWKHCLQVFRLDKPIMTSQNNNIAAARGLPERRFFHFRHIQFPVYLNISLDRAIFVELASNLRHVIQSSTLKTRKSILRCNLFALCNQNAIYSENVMAIETPLPKVLPGNGATQDFFRWVISHSHAQQASLQREHWKNRAKRFFAIAKLIRSRVIRSTLSNY